MSNSNIKMRSDEEINNSNAQDVMWQEVFALASKEGRSLEFFEVALTGHKAIMGSTCSGMTMTMAKTED